MDETVTLSHDEQMIAKVDAQQALTEQAIQGDSLSTPESTTELIGGKFKSQEELLKAYKELESKLGNPGEPQAIPESTPADVVDETKQAVVDAGLDFDGFYTEFSTNGNLSDASYEALASKGIPIEVVNAYIEGQSAQRQLVEMEVKKSVGGDTEYNKMLQWASTALTPAEIAEFNKPLSVPEYRKAVDSLYGKYVRVNGKSPSLVTATGMSTPTAGYQTKSEMMKDMNSPQYKKDAGFRAIVQNKLAVSRGF